VYEQEMIKLQQESEAVVERAAQQKALRQEAQRVEQQRLLRASERAAIRRV
jgi:hypothetical protein